MKKTPLFWLQLCSSLIFLGRAWQLLRWDAPLRSLLWSQKTMEPVITGIFGIPWQNWVGSLAVDSGIQTTIRIMGAVLLAGSAAVWFVQNRRFARAVTASAALVMLVLILLYFRRAYYQAGMLIEHAIQCGVPILLLPAQRRNHDFKQMLFPLKVLIAFTFIGHGLYAMGYYPTPGHFVTMLMNGLGSSEDSARQILLFFGYADFVVAAMIFAPKAARPALLYMAVWGLVTAMARVIAYADFNAPLDWLAAWLHQSIYRLPHGLIPLMLWLGLTQSQKPEPVQSGYQPQAANHAAA